MTETGWLPYDLAGNFCEECGRAKMNRLLLGKDGGGCATCAEAITRHRCTKLPAVTDRAPGQVWECPDCDSFWQLTEEDEPCLDCCGECGHTVTRRRWDMTDEGERISTAPRYEPPPLWLPFRDLIPRSPFAPARYEPPAFGSCHRTDKGIMIHVKPGCRCP